MEVLAGCVQPRRMERLLKVLEGRLASVRVVVENIHHPHNMSAVLRSCEALGVQTVHVVESVEKFKIARGITKGSHKWLTLRYHRSFTECADELHGEGFRLYAAMLADDAVSLEEVPVQTPVALVFGNEHAGVSEEAQAHCDGSYMIPMHGFVQSYNVSVAVAMSLYDVTSRARSQREDGGALTAEQQTQLLQTWLPKSTPHGRKITEILKKK
jgi:tRNA (guanosine-2'-O-)-methyltransferase